MDNHDRRAIEGLFNKLGHAARVQPDRDPEAETLIDDLISRNPGAAYYLAQTVIMQEQALNVAQEQIKQAQDRPEPETGGIFGRMFGGAQPQQRPAPHRASAAAPAQQSDGPWGSGRSTGGGFMAGAAQTAMGVAGGVLLGNVIGGMFAGPADAAEAPQEPAAQDEDTSADAEGFDDGGFDDFE
ncbi:DUF2076 domain-containing protein [Paracoccus caeni]|uniref:DUF2076 domain-containing protein n=1 Tax=Paracoccus caeni TaxID=657651 RepID=A0A934W1D3_9RHOB|nr:DUF2076 domain-containing protein [Paracoccus caeni]MBK4216689.1 DUF2076 domain-containing protein [Paracoccus caeni]